MSELVPATGSSQLAAVIASHVGGKVGGQRAQIEFARMVSLSGALGLQPDSWSAAPFERSHFLIAEPLEAGTPDSTDTAGGPDDHSHGIDSRPALQAGDRVLIAWVGPSPVVIARLH